MARPWNTVINVALATGVTAVGLAGIEGYLRWQGTFEVNATPGCYAFSDDPRLMYDLKPHCLDGGSGTTNAWGMRDSEVDSTAPGDRIAALGDSITYGPGVSMDETWPKRLQQLMGRAARRTTVLNFAVQGYSTVQEVETLRVKALQFHPRVVLLQYCFNDEDIYTTIFDGMIDDLRRRQGEGYLEGLDLRHGWLVRRFLLSRTAIATRLALDRLRLTTMRSTPHDNVITEYYREHSPVREGLVALKNLTEAENVHALVLIFPHAYGAFGLPGFNAYPSAWVFDNAPVLALCRELGLECIDLAARFHADPLLRELPGSHIFADGCCHLRQLGHKTMAWVIFHELAARGWLDARQ